MSGDRIERDFQRLLLIAVAVHVYHDWGWAAVLVPTICGVWAFGYEYFRQRGIITSQ